MSQVGSGRGISRRKQAFKAMNRPWATETEKRLTRIDAIADQANQAINSLSSPWAIFVEDIVAPAALRLFQERGIAVQEVYQHDRN